MQKMLLDDKRKGVQSVFSVKSKQTYFRDALYAEPRNKIIETKVILTEFKRLQELYVSLGTSFKWQDVDFQLI